MKEMNSFGFNALEEETFYRKNRLFACNTNPTTTKTTF